jgi:hypothetical protein
MYSQEEQFFKKVHWNLIHSITLLIIQIKALTITDEGFISWWASCESNTAPTDYESAALTKHELEAQKL